MFCRFGFIPFHRCVCWDVYFLKLVLSELIVRYSTFIHIDITCFIFWMLVFDFFFFDDLFLYNVHCLSYFFEVHLSHFNAFFLIRFNSVVANRILFLFLMGIFNWHRLVTVWIWREVLFDCDGRSLPYIESRLLSIWRPNLLYRDVLGTMRKCYGDL